MNSPILLLASASTRCAVQDGPSQLNKLGIVLGDGDDEAPRRDGQRQGVLAPGLADVVVNLGKGEAVAAGFDRVERTASREVVRDAGVVRDEPEDGDRGSGGPVSVHW